MTHPPYEPYPVSSHPSYPVPSDRDRQVPPPSTTKAGWALGLAMFPSVITWVISVVFACEVIARSKDGREHGKGMAVAALVIVGVWVVVASTVVTVLVATGADRDQRGQVTDGGRTTIVGLHVGDCLPAPEEYDEEQWTARIVPCGEPHDAEVYATFDLDAWTTVEQASQVSEGGCFERFADYVGVRPRRSSLDVMYYMPNSQTSFDQDQAVLCILVAPELSTASLEGSRR